MPKHGEVLPTTRMTLLLLLTSDSFALLGRQEKDPPAAVCDSHKQLGTIPERTYASHHE